MKRRGVAAALISLAALAALATGAPAYAGMPSVNSPTDITAEGDVTYSGVQPSDNALLGTVFTFADAANPGVTLATCTVASNTSTNGDTGCQAQVTLTSGHQLVIAEVFAPHGFALPRDGSASQTVTPSCLTAAPLECTAINAAVVDYRTSLVAGDTSVTTPAGVPGTVAVPAGSGRATGVSDPLTGTTSADTSAQRLTYTPATGTANGTKDAFYYAYTNGTDVVTGAVATTVGPAATAALPETPFALLLPVIGLGVVVLRRRRPRSLLAHGA